MSQGYDYPNLLRDATLGVVRSVLASAAADGLPGEHHFYLTFRTGAPGVEVPAAFRARYPDKMTVVLQNQYSDLVVDDAGFAVTLRFGGSWEQLRVPYEALTTFLDPSVPFGLDFTQFNPGDVAEGESDAAGAPVSPAAGEREISGEVPVASSSEEPPPEDGDGSHGGDLLPFRRP